MSTRDLNVNIFRLSLILVGGVIITVTLYAGLLLYLTWPVTEHSINKSGVFGDSFGLLTALFSGLAFAGLIITIVMQKEELRLQREELKLTRIEFTGQKEELKVQNETLKKQQFENTFFQMMSLHQEIVKGIDTLQGSHTLTGRDVFQVIKSKMDNGKPKQLLSSANIDDIHQGYVYVYNTYQNELGHYFRYLYNIVKFIDQSSVENQRFYSNLLRAQLSNYELILLFYNCLSEFGREKFKPLVEKFGLLKNMPTNLALNFAAQKELYAQEAYNGS